MKIVKVPASFSYKNTIFKLLFYLCFLQLLKEYFQRVHSQSITFYAVTLAIYECSGEQLAKNIIKTQMSHYNRIRYLAELNKNISVKTNDEHNMLIDAIRNKDKRMYLRVIKAHISRIFNELDKLKGIYPEYFEKN